MLNKMLKSLFLGFTVFLAGLLLCYVIFGISYKKSISAASNALAETQKVSAKAQNIPLSESEITKVDYFIARYDGKNIAIYCVSDNQEEFLYTLNARIEDISPQELADLKSGIKLTDKKALASFEEDFTS